MSVGDQATHWQRVAGQWSQVGPPLRPSPEDLAFFERAAGKVVARLGRAPRVLLLGVTPELYRLPWPAGTDFLAADRSEAMIDIVWPGPREVVVRTEWLDLALPPGSRDVVLCDGGLHLLDWPEGQRRLAELLSRAVAPGGVVAVRLFTPPAVREDPARVLDDFAAGRIASLNILKLRLGAAMMPSVAEGVRLARVWDAINAAAPDRDAFAARIGWTPEHLAAIDSYRGSEGRYHFATLDEVTATFAAAGFRVASVDVPAYELGDQCPTVAFEREG